MAHALQQFKAEFFKALAHPARIRILEALRTGEKTVTELQCLLEMEPSSVSQQLAILRMKNIVVGRKVATNCFYSVHDPQIFQLLNVARDIFNSHLIDLQAMAEDEGQEEKALALSQGAK